MNSYRELAATRDEVRLDMMMDAYQSMQHRLMAAAYLIDRLDAAYRGKRVTDLDEAWEAYRNRTMKPDSDDEFYNNLIVKQGKNWRETVGMDNKIEDVGFYGHNPMPNPTEDMLEDPVWEAIWSAIKTWDLNVPESYSGYCNANGSHATVIFNAILPYLKR